LDDGTVVTPDQVTEEPSAKQVFAFLFMPDETYLESFVQSFNTTKFNSYTKLNIDQKHNLVSIYHSVPKNVFMNEKYREILT
jgi:hypothetical protein